MSITKTTPLRDQDTCVKIMDISGFWGTILKRWRRRNHPHIKDLSLCLARDAGLSVTEIAQHQQKWPSEGADHLHR
jgi:hypothetical protein